MTFFFVKKVLWASFLHLHSDFFEKKATGKKIQKVTAVPFKEQLLWWSFNWQTVLAQMCYALRQNNCKIVIACSISLNLSTKIGEREWHFFCHVCFLTQFDWWNWLQLATIHFWPERYCYFSFFHIFLHLVLKNNKFLAIL